MAFMTYQNTRHKPDNGRQEAESLGGPPATADIVMSDSAPAESTSAVDVVQSIDQKTKGGKPSE
jgi:hypothetical protein